MLLIRDITDLPLEVLLKILASLDLFAFRTSRLVCKAFWKASIHCVTRLQCNCLSKKVTTAQLAQRLSVFSSITELHLGLALPRDASMLALPAVLSTLCSLTLGFVGNKEAVSHSWEAIVPSLAGATQLTVLTIDIVAVEGAGFKLADILRAFTAVEELTLDSTPYAEPESLAEAVSQLPRLRNLRSLDRDDRFLGAVVRNATRMMCLQSLECLAESRNAAEHLATLTQLTQLTHLSLGWLWQGDASSQLIQLSRLTSMQVLKLPRTELRIDQLRQLVSPMMQLRELQFCTWEADAAVELDPLLARLPMMTKLDLSSLSPLPTVRLPASVLFNGFASLRAISLPLWGYGNSRVVQLAKAFTGLESLKLTCSDHVVHTFLSHLPCARNLTELDLQFNGKFSHACAGLGLLAELQNLKRLALLDPADVLVGNDDVRSIAALTGLTELCIRQSSRWHAQPLTSAQLQPLTALIRLKRLFSSSPLVATFRASGFRRALHGRQHELGLPPTYIMV
eukprot:jgi/Botrbrau1/17239/Bobra.0015s0002.1